MAETAEREKSPLAKRALRRHLSLGVKRRSKPGASPGVLIADPDARSTTVSAMAYSASEVVERDSPGMDEIAALRAAYPCVWIDVHGLKDLALIEALGAAFRLHPLALEDVVNIHQRAKAEEYEDTLFIVLRMAAEAASVETGQVAIFLGAGFVLTFQERKGDVFDQVRARIRKNGARLRGAGADYLAYALIDAVIDGYFPVLDQMSDRLEALEDAVIEAPDRTVVQTLHRMKHELLALRRAIGPHREMVGSLLRLDCPLIGEPTALYLRDCHDHAVQLIDIVETYREIASGALELYLSSLSNRMNEVMKVLTIIATIFIPLSFVAGLYGMNFDPAASPWNMPELGWRYGYPLALLLMAGIAVGLVWMFWRKGWFGRDG